MILNYILEHEKYDTEEYDIGITKLLEFGIYKAAYPPHEGTTNDETQERGRLYKKWGTYSTIFSYQPIDEIKEYFGMKFALYFTWIGFYTYMLVPASILGVVCFLYGLATINRDTVSNEICDKNNNMLMCPQCDKHCDYWKLSDACFFYKIRYLFDNNASYVFAFLMSIWSALYLKLWRRYSAEITHRWGLTGFSLYAEHPRIRYKSFISKQKKCDINDEEPKISFWTMKLPCLLISYSIVIFWMLLVGIFIFSLVLYSMNMATSDYIYGTTSNKYKKTLFVPLTAALLNLIGISFLNLFYNRVAVWLTNIEFQRTQVQFDDSLQLKIYLFQFVNYYSSIFYIAFLKGRFVGYPKQYNRIWGYRQEECEPGGCYLEITIQLATFMIGEQLGANFIEYIWPHILKFQNTLSRTNENYCTSILKLFRNICLCWCYKSNERYPRWYHDISLNSWNTELFEEYLEMVIQYGFLTIFVTAFPLAPLIALLNNVFIEMKLDTKKFIRNYRRPVAQRVANIGIWFYIMKIIAQLSIITNGWIIASSTNLVPMLVYRYKYNTADGFVNYSLAYFDVNDFENGTKPLFTLFNQTKIQDCRYAEYRDKYYNRTFGYWQILAGKLLFVCIYQNAVSFVVMLIEWIIPDIPRKLKMNIKTEEIILSNILLKHKDNN